MADDARAVGGRLLDECGEDLRRRRSLTGQVAEGPNDQVSNPKQLRDLRQGASLHLDRTATQLDVQAISLAWIIDEDVAGQDGSRDHARLAIPDLLELQTGQALQHGAEQGAI